MDKKSLSQEWQWAFYISEQVAQMPTARFDLVYREFLKTAGIDRRAKPYVTPVGSIPPEVAAWQGQFVDLNLDQLEDQVLREHAEQAFAANLGAIALRLGGKWMAIKNQGRPQGIVADYWNVLVMSIDDAQAQKMVRLPDDWEGQVSVGGP